MKKEIFDSLARLSPDSPAMSTSPQQSPTAEIPGELAFCLETLMNKVGKEMNLSPQSVLERILDAGVDGWVGQLSDNTKRSVGLINGKPHTSKIIAHDDIDDEDDPDPAHAQQAAYAQMTESYGYTPLTAHTMSANGQSNGRKDHRSNGSNGRKNSKSKKVRPSGKKHPPKRSQSSRRRKFSTPKNHTSAQ
ncbi:MAG: hypothetical protein JXX29_11390 [Deltaproteobacteria bacterium]|nr:hypothetical protein [Deltaproteobacteria bacterium]MBN2672275.1 hypothetical protein [Deltaproteobacteria bacterium]